MRLLFKLFGVLVALSYINASFINPYPRFESYNDGGNPGEALYLTKYIENGDIETVRLFFLALRFIRILFVSYLSKSSIKLNELQLPKQRQQRQMKTNTN